MCLLQVRKITSQTKLSEERKKVCGLFGHSFKIELLKHFYMGIIFICADFEIIVTKFIGLARLYKVHIHCKTKHTNIK